jgi:hypothetical protein
MKNLFVVVALAALAGCAYPGPGYYTTAVAQPVGDPHEWHVVSSQPVQTAQAGTYQQPQQYQQQYTSAAPVYSSPVYVQDPYYVTSPVYVQQPYYYPPVSIGLDFGFGGWCCGGRGGWGRGGWGRGGFHHR